MIDCCYPSYRPAESIFLNILAIVVWILILCLLFYAKAYSIVWGWFFILYDLFAISYFLFDIRRIRKKRLMTKLLEKELNI